MASWIERSKNTLKEIIDNVRKDNPDLEVRVCFVGYRDVQDLPRFSLHDFTTDLDKIKKYISGVMASGGGDFPEDVQGGFHEALKQQWNPNSIKMAFHIFDAPGHGKDICPGPQHDNHPKGSPDGHKIQDQMAEFARRKINFTAVKVNEQCNAMIKVMTESYAKAGNGNQMILNDLANACANKSQDEVTKDFISKSSYILRATLGGGAPGSAPVSKSATLKKGKAQPALWDTKQFAVGQMLSQTTYYNVKEIAGDRITVEDQHGGLMHVSRDIVEKMASATHYAKEVGTNMTGLAELLEQCSDTVFSVQFHKQPNKESAQELLEATNYKDLKDKKKLAELSKQITEGGLCEMICHLVKTENNLGRSTVIDLSSISDNKFRQIDHRTIQYIIFKNVKYSLKKGGKKEEEEEEKKKSDAALWDKKDLAVGNWFSRTSYFHVKEISGDEVKTSCDGKEVVVSKDILEQEMYNAGVYAKEEKLALTKVVKVLKEANSAAFTICFNCKIDEKVVQEKLSGVSEKEFKDAKSLAKELLTGKESTAVGRLSKTEGKLGRSLVIGLPANNFVSVDHRTIKWLILKNVKYIVS